MRYLRFVFGICALSLIITTTTFGHSPEYKAGRAADHIDYCGKYELNQALYNKYGKSEDYESGKSDTEFQNMGLPSSGNSHKINNIDCDQLERFVKEILSEGLEVIKGDKTVKMLQCHNASYRAFYRHNCKDTVTYRNGDKYVGEWKDNKFNGQGILTFASGDRYDGKFKNGKAHGNSTYYYIADNEYKGDRYVGGFKDDKADGQGTYYHLAENRFKGDKYVGAYKDDKRHGRGTYTFADGRIKDGIWKAGKLFYVQKLRNKPEPDTAVLAKIETKRNASNDERARANTVKPKPNFLRPGPDHALKRWAKKAEIDERARIKKLTKQKQERRGQAKRVTEAYKIKKPDAIAVIIGNRDYKGDTPDVEFAINDADAMREFVLNKLGYRPGNVIDLRDATQAELLSAFGSDKSHKGTLFDYVRSDESDVIVFYSGHGVPGLSDRRGYLLSVDANPNKAELTGYPVDTLLKNLAKIPAKSMTVFIDACFSGNTPKGMLVDSMSGLTVEIRQPKKASKGMVVLTASRGDQVASWDKNAKHGLFTKHLLEALNGAADKQSKTGNKDGKVTLGEVKAYLDREMTYQARRRFSRDQHATVSGDLKTVLSAY